jgi:hypothetical protein
MEQEIQTTASRPAGSAKPAAHPLRDQQRAALRDLLALTAECAATEEHIERQFRLSNDHAKKELEARQTEIESRYAQILEKHTQGHQRALEKIVAEYEVHTAQSAEDFAQAQARIKWEHNESERKIRNQIEEAKWLAEGEVETARNQIREENEELSKIFHAHEQALVAVEQPATALLGRCCRQMPPVAAVENAAQLDGQDLRAAMTAQVELAEKSLARMRHLLLPKFVFGVSPWIFLVLLCAAAGGIATSASGGSPPDLKVIGLAVGGTFLVAVILGLVLRGLGKSQILDVYKPLAGAIALGREAARLHAENVTKRQEAHFANTRARALRELQELKQKAAVAAQSIESKRSTQKSQAHGELESSQSTAESNRRAAEAAAQEELDQQKNAAQQERNDDLAAAQQLYQQRLNDSRKHHEESLVALKQRLVEGLAHTRAPEHSSGNGDAQRGGDSGEVCWQNWENWVPATSFPQTLRFGELRVDLQATLATNKTSGPVKLQFPAAYCVPVNLEFPYGASLLVQYERSGRPRALRMMQALMIRILTGLPPGRARFTIIDPVGLGQNFAGFMRLADHDETLVGGRIWTRPEQIEQRLSDLTEHMETVIQKYLRNEFATIDDYNAQAGELAEPYRFVVVADFPTGFERESFRRLASIAATGARCGVYILVAGDAQIPPASAGQLDDIAAHCVHLVQQGETFKWKDEVLGQFPLSLDEPPAEESLTPLLDKIGQAAKASQNVEVSFDTIAPTADEFWTLDSTDGLNVPIGRMGATRLQMLRLGRAMAQHGLLAGKTGSGKSTLLHAIVTNLAMWYSPDQIELYLIDFKKGVEFKTYATHHLPHARAIAVESDREFGLSVLERLDVELGRRGELFRQAGVQDLPSYRRSAGAEVMPRTLLVIDEFQEFFSEDDKLAQQAGLLMDRLVRQGRAFGIHLLLGSQTIGGTSGLARSTIGQMAVRIALQVSEADSQIILGDNNSAARLLSRPGAAIYNDAGGLVEANSPFQVAWLPDEKREVYLEHISQRAVAVAVRHEPPVIFEGNAPADAAANKPLAALLQSARPAVIPATVKAWIGEPVAIKEPTVLTLRRQSGSNVLLVGQQEEQSLSVMVWVLISLFAQYPAGGAAFYILDGAAADSRLAGSFEQLKPALGPEMELVQWRAIAEMIHTVVEIVRRRLTEEQAGAEEVFLFIYGLQRYRMLRKSDDDFSFSMSGGDEAKGPNPAREFGEILRDGPGVGIHVITWVDTLASLERTFERSAQREFDNRVLFQMSASDSSSLIDSPAANNLGFYRALSCSEEQGVMEKFRPYALPSAQWIQEHQRAETTTSE